jgi:hypothetical protein
MNTTQTTGNDVAPDPALVKTVEMFSIDDAFLEEMQRLGAVNRELLERALQANPADASPASNQRSGSRRAHMHA